MAYFRALTSGGGGGTSLNPSISSSDGVKSILANGQQTFTIDASKDYILNIWPFGNDISRVYVYSVLKGVLAQLRAGIGMSSVSISGTTITIQSQSSLGYGCSLVQLD